MMKAERERLYQDYSDQMRMTVKPVSFEAWLEEREKVKQRCVHVSKLSDLDIEKISSSRMSDKYNHLNEEIEG